MTSDMSLPEPTNLPALSASDRSHPRGTRHLGGSCATESPQGYALGSRCASRGAVASAVEPPNQETLHEIAQTPSPPTRTEFGLRRVPVPPEVITLAVRCTCGSPSPPVTWKSSRARYRGRSRDGVRWVERLALASRLFGGSRWHDCSGR